MNVRKVKHTAHLWNYAVYLLVIGLAVVSVLIASSPETETLQDNARPVFLLPLTVVFLFFVYFAYQFVSFWIIHIRLARRRKRLRLEAKKKGMHSSRFVPVGSALFSITKKRPKFTNSFVGDSWGYTDFSYSELTKNHKREWYTVNSYYFAVAAFDLPRALPNVFFDSKRTGKREFSLLFREDQRHDLEGDFHTHFATYFTEDYTIDSLTFITPDVMLALVEANQYDIEIFGNKLYLINELEGMPTQLNDIEQKGKKIRYSLMRNMLNYRDERIGYEHGRKTVSIAGLLLRRSMRKYTVMAGLGGTITVLGAAAGALNVDPYVALYGIILGLGILAYASIFIYDIRRTNKQLRRQTGIY